MAHRFINQLREGEQVNEIYVVSEKQLRTNRNGNLYLQVRLSDRTGSLTAMLWNANEKLYNSFENGDYLRAHGATQFYNGGLQMILNRVERAQLNEVEEADYITLDVAQVETLQARLGELLRATRNHHLRSLAESFLMDDGFMSKFSQAPAGIKHHHAFRGGLLQHVVNVMELCALIAPRYPDMDADLLMLGAFLHDVGKIEELVYDRELGYSDAGQLVGHMSLGVSILEQKLAQAAELTGEAFPQELALQLKHMILSHHGQLDFGSPKVPMTLEALALHYIDSLDSKVHCFQQIIEEDANEQSPWTPFVPSLQRKIYKGGTTSS